MKKEGCIGMIRRLRWVVVAAGGGLLAMLLPVSVAANAPPTVYPIGVDHAGPANHDFEYVDFFPRAGIRLHAGDVFDFGWAQAPDGLHTSTLLKTGETVAQGLQEFPLVVPDTDDPGGQLQFNPAVLFPTSPTCGTAANPCTYDGTSSLNSGAVPTDGTSQFFARITAPAGSTVTFMCAIHPGMVGTATVVPDNQPATPLPAVRGTALAQSIQDTVGALRAEAQAEATSVQQNPDGTRTITMTAGTATDFVEVVEMLPQTVTVRAGDTVRWVTKTKKDPHTVTFPQGDDPSTEPIPQVCEGQPVDTPASTTGPPCSNLADFEIHLNPFPFGPTVISSPTTVATSGIIDTFPQTPFPDNYSFSFPNAGTFGYQCRIHDHMVGTVIATP
jgi:plastocyanin